MYVNIDNMPAPERAADRDPSCLGAVKATAGSWRGGQGTGSLLLVSRKAKLHGKILSFCKHRWTVDFQVRGL